MIPDEFCDFETNKCIWDGSALTWSWTRKNIKDLGSSGPPYDHRGGNNSEYSHFIDRHKSTPITI